VQTHADRHPTHSWRAVASAGLAHLRTACQNRCGYVCRCGPLSSLRQDRHNDSQSARRRGPRCAGRPARQTGIHSPRQCPEFTAHALAAWCDVHCITLHYIQPGKPAQNAFIERFNRTYRTEILDAYVFASLTEVRELTSGWLDRYNTQRPHDSLGHLPPLTYRPRPTTLSESILKL
jgi:transposase InsO family protein